MKLSLRPSHVHRYQQIAVLLARHGGGVLRATGAGEVLDAAPEPQQVADAEALTGELEAMGPTFVKLGQLLASRVDLLPAAYTTALARLQDDVAPLPFAEVEGIIAEELGVRPSRVFAEFEPSPLAAASLGQVHTAVLRDGTPVAVKVQRPGVRARVAEDVEVLEELASFLDEHSERSRRFALSDLVSQFSRSLVDELDYRREAANLLTIRELLADQPRIVVPRPHPDFSTSRLLTMDLLDGRKVTEVTPLARLDHDLAGLADELFRAYLRQVLVAGTFHADPHPGNVLVTRDGRLGLVDLGQVGRLAPSVRDRLVKMFVALGDGQSDEVARALSDLGTPLDGFDEAVFARLVADTVGRVGQQLPAGSAVLELARDSAEAGLRPAPELAMLGKVLLSLDEVAACLDPDFVADEAVRRHTAEILRHGASLSPGKLLGAMLETREFAEQLPGRVNRAMDAVASGRFQLRVQAFDEAEFLRGLHKLANVGASGVVIAALIIGAALLAGPGSHGTRATVALVVFVVAALLGVAMLVQIFLSTRRVAPRRRR
jgi:ubiquinone biosynthesis protein